MMMRAVVAVLAIASVAACATKPVAPAAGPEIEIRNRIAGYAQKSSEAMQRLAALRGSNGGVQSVELEIPAGLDKPMSITWTGPVDLLVKRVAEFTGYTYDGVIGQKPATPVVVSVAVTNTAAFRVLVDASAQSGSAAEIVVRPDSRKLLVKYPAVTQSGGFVSAEARR